MTDTPISLPPRSGLSRTISDIAVVARRNVIKIGRVPEVLVFVLLSPIMFVLLFAYVFGNSIEIPGGSYREFLIAEPTQDKVFWNMGGRISVSVSIEPSLQDGHGIVMYLDGQPVNNRPEVSTSFQLEEVWPITHTVRAEVVEIESGRVLRTTPDVQFHVRQRTVN